MEKRAKIEITYHAKQRLAERVPDIHPSNYTQFVMSARYNGAPIGDFNNNPEMLEYLYKYFRSDNSTQLRVYRDCVFVFRGNKGKARTLVTVVKMHEQYCKENFYAA